jgi:hypothetical protein
MDKMANWPQVLQGFKDVLKKSQKTVQVPPEDLSTPFRLLRLIARNNTSKNYNATEANFLYAAMHIACMKELRFQSGACPDLPENLDGLVRS